MLRAMWCRHWCKLNVVSSAAGCLPALGQCFEELVQARERERRATAPGMHPYLRHWACCPGPTLMGMVRLYGCSMLGISGLPAAPPLTSWRFCLAASAATHRCSLSHVCPMSVPQAHDPRLFFHMVQLQLPPLKVALPWIHGAFVKLLEPAGW